MILSDKKVLQGGMAENLNVKRYFKLTIRFAIQKWIEKILAPYPSG
jgi:hypothetical protein